MPTKAPVALVRRREACRRLGGISSRTFSRRWARVFSNPNPGGDRGRGYERQVYADELELAVERGNGPLAAAAVLALRQQKGRL